MKHEPMRTLRECLWWMSSVGTRIDCTAHLTRPYLTEIYSDPQYPNLRRFRLKASCYETQVFCANIEDFDYEFIKACNQLRDQLNADNSK